MECTKCNSAMHKNGVAASGNQQWRCPQCGHNFTEQKKNQPTISKVGMSLTEFREKHDVEFIIDKTLIGLDRKMIYEKGDVIKLSKLSAGTPGISTVLDSRSEYYGKISGRIYFSHPSTIAELKEQGKLN